jgi:Leucine-rich repeat (LRR) protein
LFMPLLEELDLSLGWIKDLPSLSPLSHCKQLKRFSIRANRDIEDLSPLCQCPSLEHLDIAGLVLIKDISFFEKGFTKLRTLEIENVPVNDLSPLTRLQNLEELNCYMIPETTSLLPLA